MHLMLPVQGHPICRAVACVTCPCDGYIIAYKYELTFYFAVRRLFCVIISVHGIAMIAEFVNPW